MPAKKIKTQNKSDFIRAQPASMPAADVVKKAKASGLKIRAGLVYEVRRVARAKRRASAKLTAAASASSAVTSTTKPAQSKAAFVRSLPKSMSAKEVVAEARKNGIKIADTYVYWARRTGKGLAKTTARRSTVRQAPAIKRPITTSSKVEELLKAVAAEIGLGRAIEILAGERARVRAVMRG
jgi:hypothetical protein